MVGNTRDNAAAGEDNTGDKTGRFAGFQEKE